MDQQTYQWNKEPVESGGTKRKKKQKTKEKKQTKNKKGIKTETCNPVQFSRWGKGHLGGRARIS